MDSALYFDWEIRLILFLQEHMGSFGTALASAASALGEELLMTAVFLFFYFVYEKETGVFIGLSLMLSINLNAMLKNVFLRLRPYFVHEGIQCLKPAEKSADIYDIAAQGYSFPSGHSAHAASMYGSAAYRLRKKWVTAAAVVISLLVGLSRFSLGVHYPTDVFAGWLVGLLALGAVALLHKKITKKSLLYLIILLVSLPGIFFCKSDDYFTGLGMTAGFMAGDLFERRFVQFENTRNVIRAVLRMLLGIGLFLGLNALLKLPFSKTFLEEFSVAEGLVRAGRYAVICFIIIGIFPMSFRLTDRLLEKKPHKKEE